MPRRQCKCLLGLKYLSGKDDSHDYDSSQKLSIYSIQIVKDIVMYFDCFKVLIFRRNNIEKFDYFISIERVCKMNYILILRII